MPITRRERRELDRSLRRLRSGKCLRPQPATLPSMCRSGRQRKQSGLLVFTNPDLIAEEAALEEPQRREEFFPELEEGTSAEIDLAEHDSQHTRTSGGTASEGASHIRHAEDVGIPINKKWGFVAAHVRRFCFDHGKDEWLLEYNDRWMSPGDFNFSEAEVTLKKMLQDYQSNAITSKSHKRASPVECNCRLWSEVDTPVQYNNIGDKYLIRWKWRWTPESDIDDLDWVNASYNAQNVMIKRRYSARLEKNDEARVANRKSMMVVVDLEKRLAEAARL
jgi:hypothetical protein